MASISFFVTGIPGDEEKRAGMALQYPLLSASVIQPRQFFYSYRVTYTTNTNFPTFSLRTLFKSGDFC